MMTKTVTVKDLQMTEKCMLSNKSRDNGFPRTHIHDFQLQKE